MERRTSVIAVGAVTAVGLAVVISASSMLGGTPTPSPQAVAAATSTASATPEPTSSSTSSLAPTPSPDATVIPTPSAAPTPILVPAPLTGRMVTPDVAARHPIAVMIDDLRAARPQSGLSSASVVWQAPAEGGIPRYMAIFQDQQPDLIGPVRSSRYYYIAWAAEWRALYAHAGGSPGAKATLKAKGNGQLVYNVDEFRFSGTFHRINTRQAPHNLYTTGAKLRSLSKSRGAKDQVYTPAWNFAPDAPLETRPTGGTIMVKYPYNTINYAYDRTTNTYLRSVTGEKQQTDAANGIKIAPQNVIVMRMKFGALNDGHPGAPRLEATVVGSGPAWISTNGRTIKGTWKKTSLTNPTQFYDASGHEVTLTVGQTFVQVVPASYSVAFKAGVNPLPSTAVPSASPSGL